ncbi:hypothetical protein GOBAR_DD22731 [Gossypium barbadense]|nr:hypothetical protein GOBAR_DD22731 [Gossypium barbadense]
MFGSGPGMNFMFMACLVVEEAKENKKTKNWNLNYQLLKLFTTSDECCSVQLSDGDGSFNDTGIESFIKEVKLHECGLSYAVVSIMGPQSSVATPKQIRELMQVDGLTNDEVKSHLQKYQLHTRRLPATTTTTTHANQSGLVLGGGHAWMCQDQFGESSKGSSSQWVPLKMVVVECDSSQAVQLLNDGQAASHNLALGAKHEIVLVFAGTFDSVGAYLFITLFPDQAEKLLQMSLARLHQLVPLGRLLKHQQEHDQGLDCCVEVSDYFSTVGLRVESIKHKIWLSDWFSD